MHKAVRAPQSPARATMESRSRVQCRKIRRRSIAHFKEAQRLDPDNWNYKRQAWALSDAEKNYGTSFGKEVQKLNGKPYYAPRKLPQKQ
jgi:hypothetical protein